MLKNNKEMIHPDHLFLIVWRYSIMEDHKLLLNLLVESNRSVRYAAVCDMDGKILLSRHRPSEKNFLSLAETKKELQRAANAWKSRFELENKIGKGMYVVAAYEKIKRITIPLSKDYLLFMSMDYQDGQSKGYMNVIDMTSILSILDWEPATP